MILPNKYLQETESLLGVGAIIFDHIRGATNLSELWDTVKNINNIGTFERFILGLDLLYLLELIDTEGNRIKRLVK